MPIGLYFPVLSRVSFWVRFDKAHPHVGIIKPRKNWVRPYVSQYAPLCIAVSTLYSAVCTNLHHIMNPNMSQYAPIS